MDTARDLNPALSPTITASEAHGYRLTNLEKDAAGCDVVLPRENEVFVDLDSPQDQYVMEAVIACAQANGFDIRVDHKTRSRNGNKHAYLVAPRNLSTLERICLQAIFGSDRKRELLSFLRWERNIEPEVAFFEKPTAGPSQ